MRFLADPLARQPVPHFRRNTAGDDRVVSAARAEEADPCMSGVGEYQHSGRLLTPPRTRPSGNQGDEMTDRMADRGSREVHGGQDARGGALSASDVVAAVPRPG